MISYEQCKRLKDAGFPQRLAICKRAFIDGEESLIVNYPFSKEKEEIVYIPTLSEIIDSMGNNFGYLSQPHENDWRANSDGSHEDCEGKTAIEAVSNLWLKLNEKKV